MSFTFSASTRVNAPYMFAIVASAAVDFFLLAWITQVAWNMTVPDIFRGRVRRITYTDALAVRVLLYVIVQPFLLGAVVSNFYRDVADMRVAEIVNALEGVSKKVDDVYNHVRTVYQAYTPYNA